MALLGSSELVELSEQKLHQGNISSERLTDIIKPWLSQECFIDTIVLACTHFPLLKKELNHVFMQHNKNIQWVDSAASIAKRVSFLLAERADEQLSPREYNNRAIFTAEQEFSSGFMQHLNQLNIVDVVCTPL